MFLTLLEIPSSSLSIAINVSPPSLVEHLPVVATQLDVQQVVQADGSPMYIVDCEESVDLLWNLSSFEDREPFLPREFSSHLSPSFPTLSFLELIPHLEIIHGRELRAEVFAGQEMPHEQVFSHGSFFSHRVSSSSYSLGFAGKVFPRHKLPRRIESVEICMFVLLQENPVGVFESQRFFCQLSRLLLSILCCPLFLMFNHS